MPKTTEQTILPLHYNSINGDKHEQQKQKKRCWSCWKITLLVVNIGIFMAFTALTISLILVTRDTPNLIEQKVGVLIDTNLTNLVNNAIDNKLLPLVNNVIDNKLSPLANNLLNNALSQIKPMGDQLLDDGVAKLETMYDTKITPTVNNVLYDFDKQVASLETWGENLTDSSGDNIADWINNWLPKQTINVHVQ